MNRIYIKIFSLNAVDSSMGKYFIFIVVFLFSFMINISVSIGKTIKNIETEEMDVYYKKTKVFRDWDKKGSTISKSENKLMSLYPEQLDKKKETISRTEAEATKVIVIRNALEGNVRLELPQKVSQTPVADSILNPPHELAKAKAAPQLAKQENKTFIYGNSFEQNCYLSKSACGFSMFNEVKQYNDKLNPQKEPLDTKRYPIDF